MKNLLSLAFVLCFAFSYGQFNQNAPWMNGLNDQSRTSNNPVKFQEIVDAFNNYWVTRDPDVKGSGYKPFKRWESYWENFVKADGTLPTSLELWNTYLEVKNQKNNQRSSNALVDDSNWLPVGPFTHTNTGSWSSGQGRINVIVPDPNTATTLYAGAPAGGLWKSIDAGVTWSTTTDDLPQIGVSGIAVDPNDSNIIFIATGDDDAGDSASVGVMKSTDGGQTWNNTGLNPGNSPSRMNDIYIDPTNSSTIWVATNNGVFKTTDAGVSWSNTNGTQGQNIRDIKIKPNDSNIIYAATSTVFYKSTNTGDSFLASSIGLPNTNLSRYVIDVTPANPNVVYLLAANNNNGFRGLYKSSDSGLFFTEVASPATVGDVFESNQAWFDMAFAVSDTNENEVYTGVLNIWKGNVIGNTSTFIKVNNWNAPFSASYSHADIHFLRFFNGELFAGTDGGFYKSSNGGTSFTDLTAGMQISQFYRISVSKQSSDKMVGGLQDNGGHAYNNGQWQNYYGADGMDTAIDPANSNQYYGFTQFGGGLYISSSAGGSISETVGSPTGENGNWIVPLKMSSDSQLYSGYRSLYRLQNNNWVPISSSFGSNIDVIEIDEINPNTIYLAINNSLRKSIDTGANFVTAENFGSDITSIEVNNTDNNIVYVTTSGSGGQVFKSTDGGNNFTNISAGLPNVSKNSIKHQALHSKNPLYLGTSLGVYRYDDDTLIWELFNNGLPNVSVRDIEINIFDDKVTAATYGRGIWQSNIITELAPTDVKFVALNGIATSIDCAANVMPQVEIKNNGISTITSVDFTYFIDDTANNFNWTGSLASEASIIVDLPQFNLAKGLHTFSVSSTTINDTYSLNNDSEEKVILANGPGVIEVVNTFETPQEALLVFDEGASTQYWERGIPNGTVLNDSANPTNQVYGTNLLGNHANNTKSYLVSECYDLTVLSNPEFKMDMAFNLEQDWDIVYVEYTTDQGVNWNVLGTDLDPNWYNSNTIAGQNNTCFNCPGAQWTGTNAILTEYIYDLSPFNTETSIMFRVVFHSDQSVTEEGVIIDNLVVRGNALSVDEFQTNSFLLYPNPSKGIFNIKTKTAQQFNANVYDLTGKAIFTANNIKTTNKSYQLDLSGYATGVYFLNLETDSNKITKKLIVN